MQPPSPPPGPPSGPPPSPPPGQPPGPPSGPPPGPPPGTPGPPPGGFPGQPPQQPSNGLGITSMILGIASIPLCICWGAGGLLGIAAVILGFLGKKKADEGLATNRGMALAGIITGAIGIALAIVAWILLAVGASVDWSQYTDTN